MGSLLQLSILKGPTRPLKPNLIDKLFESFATGSFANNVALIFEENDIATKFSYADVSAIANKFAKTLLNIIKEKNLQANSDGDFIIAVKMHSSPYLIITLLSIWKAGAAYLPLDHEFPKNRMDHIIQEAKPVMLIYDDDVVIDLDVEKIALDELIRLSDNNNDQNLINEERVHHSKDDLGIVLYTSGSTGVPKGVRLPHKVILNRLQWQFKTFPFSNTENVCVFKTALTFVDSVSEIWGPLINGLSLLILNKTIIRDPEKFIKILDKYKVERLVLVPSLLKSIFMYLEVQKSNNVLRNLKLWICSGETLSVSLAEEFFKYFPNNNFKLCNFYGSTEIMGDVTYHTLTGIEQLKYQNKIPIGKPIDNTMVYLLDSDYRPVKYGKIGELFVAGLNLAAGYVKGRDREKFIDNPLAIDPMYSKLYSTGDFAKIEKDLLIYEGRTDSQVKVRGHRVDLSEIEKYVNSIDGIEKTVVLCYKPGEFNQALLAFVETHLLMSENQIENLLKSQLSSYMIPQIIIVEKIPLLVNGKTDRQALLKMYENTNNNDDDCYQIDIDYSGIYPDQKKAAKDLFEIVASVLNRSARSTISVDANFYDIGGNSLNSILTITKLNEKGYHISIADFIEAIDLGEILERMTSIKTKINTQPPAYHTELLKYEHKETVLDIITSSFYEKADLEQWLMPDITESDYKELMDKLWEPLVDKNLSFIVKTPTDKIIGASLNFDAFDEPEVEITSKLTIIFEFLEYLEGPIRRQKLPQGKGKVLHCFMMGTHSSLTAKENVAIMKFMEDEELKLAKSRNFAGIFTTNTSPLTQQLGNDVYKYDTLLDYQVNNYVAPDGSKPFGMAPDSQRAIVHWNRVH